MVSSSRAEAMEAYTMTSLLAGDVWKPLRPISSSHCTMGFGVNV